jgi:chaperone required for assembly of F1-ATPase
MKRFYKAARAVERSEGGWTIELDGRPVRTPAKTLLVVRNRPLAEAVAAEWDAQTIQPNAMPLTRHANSAVDLVAPRREGVVDEIAVYGGTDLVCYRAEAPMALIGRQQAAWGPLLDWLEARYGVRLTVTEGITHVAQDPARMAVLRAAVDAYGDVEIAALHTATTILGSLVIALALAEGHLDADAAWAAARVDEAFQIERWGEDAEAAARAKAVRAELGAAARVLDLCLGRSGSPVA